MARRLGAAVAAASAEVVPEGAVVEKIVWVPAFQEEESLTEFCAATDPSGNLESNSSSGHKEYQDRLRAIALRQEGKEKGEIAALLDRSTKFVERWWRKDAHEVPRPAGVHEYLKVEFWRDIEIVRGFGAGLGIYDEILQNNQWVQPMANAPNFKKGGSYLKYDKEGRMRPQGNQVAKDGLLPGRMPNLDRLTQKLMSEQDIDDRVLKRPGLLWYPDGTSTAIPHRHECWTALLSFGAPRILTIDDHPVLLRDGDLIVFGTQRHGVPKMREEGGSFDGYGGRISAVFFFMPHGEQAKGAEPWRAIFDGGGSAPSRKAAAMLQDAALGSRAAVAGLASGAKAAEVRHLVDLGFAEAEAAAALKAAAFDVGRAADLLLGGCGPALLSVADEDGPSGASGVAAGTAREQAAQLYARLEELQQRRRQRAERAGASSSASSGDALPASEDDETLAMRLQREEEVGVSGFACDMCAAGAGADDDWEEMAILQQLQELESAQDGAVGGESLRKQFEQYEEMLEAQEAEEWDGRGDLMVREWRRERLQIEQQDPSTVYALGCGMLREQQLFELLSLHSIRVVYDFRANAEAAPSKHLLPDALKVACKARGLLYRHMALGREGAYGILKHLREDEGRNALAELVWHARRRRAAFLGAQENWREDHRLAIAARLREAGHKVMHVLTDGSLEEHPAGIQFPDFLSGEEQRLRLLEKQRQAGELRRPQKSAVSRSTEVVAKRLTQPQQEIDVGAELRKAETQAELVRAQRRLADLQRRSETSDAKAGLGPKLLGVTPWVLQEAEQQKANLAAGKTKDGKEKGKVTAGGPAPSYVWLGTGGTDGGNIHFDRMASAPVGGAASSSNSAPAAEADGLEFVECLGCAAPLPWSALEAGDGRCPVCCCQGDSSSVAAILGVVDGAVAAEDDGVSATAEVAEAFDLGVEAGVMGGADVVFDGRRGTHAALADEERHDAAPAPAPSAETCAAILPPASADAAGCPLSAKGRSAWRSQRHARRAAAGV